MFQENLSIYPDIKYGDGGLVAKLCLTLLTPWTMACQTPVPMGFPRQEYWNELPFPTPRNLPNPGIKPEPPALAGRFFTTQPPGKLIYIYHIFWSFSYIINYL